MKIKEHKHQKTIESIILHNKFDGKGSKEIQKDLISTLGFEVSRPTIDKYYKECLNGALLDELRQNLLQSIMQTASDKTAGIKPEFCQETASTTLLDIKEQKQYAYKELSSTMITYRLYVDYVLFRLCSCKIKCNIYIYTYIYIYIYIILWCFMCVRIMQLFVVDVVNIFVNCMNLLFFI